MFKKNYQMRILFYIVIISFFSLNSGCSTSKPIKKEHSLAFSSLWEGEPEKARQYLNSATDNYIKKFLLISIELSEGNFNKAKHYAEQFVADHKDIPDGEVILNLVQRRSSFPDERWIQSYAMAWREAGSPKLKVYEEFQKDYLSDNEEHDFNDYRSNIPVCTFDYLLASSGVSSGCDNEKDFKAFLGQITADLPLEIKLLVLQYLDSDVCLQDNFIITDELKKEIKKNRSDIIHQLSFELSSDMKFAIMDILRESRKDKPLSLEEIELLEKAVGRQRLGPSSYEIYSLYLDRYQSLGSKNPEMEALQASMMSNILFLPSTLMMRINASAKNSNPQTKKRLSNILEQVGKAHLKTRLMTDFLIGMSLLPYAYRIRGDAESEESLKEAYETFSKNIFHIVLSTYISTVLVWPIAPLMIDAIEYVAKDEMGFYLLLSGEEMPKFLSKLINDPLSN